MPEPRVEELTISSHPQRFREARRWLRQVVDRAGWSADECHEMAVVLSEACCNAHRHAYRGRSDRPIELQVEVGSGSLRLSVTDHGPAWTPSDPSAPRSFGPRESGYGMLLMRCMTDELSVDAAEGGTRVVMTKRRRSA